MFSGLILRQQLTPLGSGDRGYLSRENRLFVEAVLYCQRAGIPRRDLPEHFGDFGKVHRRHSRWSNRGTRQAVFEERDNEYAVIDSMIARCHRHDSGAAESEKETRRSDAPEAG